MSHRTGDIRRTRVDSACRSAPPRVRRDRSPARRCRRLKMIRVARHQHRPEERRDLHAPREQALQEVVVVVFGDAPHHRRFAPHREVGPLLAQLFGHSQVAAQALGVIVARLHERHVPLHEPHVHRLGKRAHAHRFAADARTRTPQPTPALQPRSDPSDGQRSPMPSGEHHLRRSRGSRQPAPDRPGTAPRTRPAASGPAPDGPTPQSTREKAAEIRARWPRTPRRRPRCRGHPRVVARP